MEIALVKTENDYEKALERLEVKILLGRRFLALPKDCNAPKRRGLEIAPKKTYIIKFHQTKKKLLDHVFTLVAKAPFSN